MAARAYTAHVTHVDMDNHISGTAEGADREWFEALIKHSEDLITVVADGEIRYQSPSVESVLGYTPSELTTQPFVEYVHPDDTDAVAELFEGVIGVQSSSIRRLEYRFRRADGSWAWLESTISAQAEDAISGLVLNSRDVTPRKESQQQAAVLNRVLRHNLRNGLNVVVGYAESLAEHDDESVAAAAEAIRSKAWGLYSATDHSKDLIEIIDSPAGNHKPQDVTHLLETRAAALRENHPALTVTCDLPDEQCVIGTPKLGLALDHLLTNAVEHNDAADPKLWIRVDSDTEPTEYATIVIEDNGPGIPQQERAVLTAGEETPLQHSNGLGLWIVNWIITRSGGWIEVAERTPRGSRVKLHLPPLDE